MAKTIEQAIEQMCSWAQLIDRMGNPWDEYLFQVHNKETIQQSLIREMKELLSFSSKEIFSCQTFKEKKKEVYENFAALMELNNFENPEWTKEEAPLVDEIEIRIYQRGPLLSLSHKKKDRWYSI